ncbi:glycoside hydrolase family 11 protein, partial [Hyaloscypha hepaticicola]
RNITFTGTHNATAGIVTFQGYGWSKNPLVKYYIMEDNTSSCQLGGGGGATDPGSECTIFETTRTNEPPIIGTSTFHQ